MIIYNEKNNKQEAKELKTGDVIFHNFDNNYYLIGYDFDSESYRLVHLETGTINDGDWHKISSLMSDCDITDFYIVESFTENKK